VAAGQPDDLSALLAAGLRVEPAQLVGAEREQGAEFRRRPEGIGQRVAARQREGRPDLAVDLPEQERALGPRSA
jgi:hypothetical protein